jgi:formate hydrogenlyase transcriptional activator
MAGCAVLLTVAARAFLRNANCFQCATVTPDGFDTAGTLRLAIEASPNGLLVTNAEGTIQVANTELGRQFGYAPDELIGQNVGMLVPAAMRSIQAAAQAPAAEADRDVLGRRKDGSPVAVELELKPIDTAGGRFVLASVVNIDAHLRIPDARRPAIEARPDFEQFIADLCFQFINVPRDKVVETIRHGLGRIGGELNLECCLFARISDADVFEPVTWTAPGIAPVELPLLTRARLPWTVERVRAGEPVVFSELGRVPSEIDRTTFAAMGTRSAVCIPLSVEGRVSGVVGFNTVRAERSWSPEIVQRLRIVGGVFEQVLARQQRDETILAASLEVQRLKDRLEAKNVYLRRDERERLGQAGVVGHSAAVRRVMEQIQQVAPTDSTVLLLGETGTGKELFATQIHELGARRGHTMVRVNCGAIPATLIESELFGREKGAFTGALSRQVGRFELADHSTIFLDEIGDLESADHSTIFLDEIGDLPFEVQVKLLRALEEHQIERLGSPRPIAVDTRIIAATHRNLEQRIAEGAFREDLYYRLNVFPIHVPPLRDRVEDIPLLVWRFVEEFSHAFGKRIDTIDKDSLAALQHHAWPGNIRELRNVVERAMISASSRRLSIPLPQTSTTTTKRNPRLFDVEKDHIRTVLEATGWRIRGAAGAADKLGLKPTTLETRMAKLGLKRPGHV